MGEAARDLYSQPEDGSLTKLSLLSYNIQTGVDTRRFHEYLIHSWKHVLPHRDRLLNLNRIATMLSDYDVVGLQEVDSGSLRSGFVDQTEYLAHRAGYPHWYRQINRRLGKLAQHSNGVLSRIRPSDIQEYKLPGLPGRGAILMEFATTGDQPLVICIMHLALGRRVRGKQLAFIGELVRQYSYIAVMGDFNCGCDSRELRTLVADANLQGPECSMKTFPSWRPKRNLDHILVSESLQVENAHVVNYPLSDHLPVSMNVALPEGTHLIR